MKIYAYCKACHSIVYRYRDHTWGDGQTDTDENPVWLLSDDASGYPEEMIKELPEILCGCNK